MTLSNYCTITPDGITLIDIDSGWHFRCNLHGMTPNYAKHLMRRLAKKRRLSEDDELLTTEVMVPDIHRQRQITGAINSAMDLWINAASRGKLYNDLYQRTGDIYYKKAQRFSSQLFRELNEYRYMLVDQLMGV